MLPITAKMATGRLLVWFTNVLWPEEPIRITAVLGEPNVTDPSREMVLARIEKADGTVALVAEGSVPRAYGRPVLSAA